MDLVETEMAAMLEGFSRIDQGRLAPEAFVHDFEELTTALQAEIARRQAVRRRVLALAGGAPPAAALEAARRRSSG